MTIKNYFDHRDQVNNFAEHVRVRGANDKVSNHECISTSKQIQKQIAQLEKHATILSSSLDTIELRWR
jgi:hypothetical protein